jgi:hypothetical protein
VRETVHADSHRAERSAASPLRAFPERRFPADSWLPGHMPAQDARCAAMGNRLMSTPISAMITSAVRLPTPGIVVNRRVAHRKGRSPGRLRIKGALTWEDVIFEDPR